MKAKRHNNFAILFACALMGCGNQSGDSWSIFSVEQVPWYEIAKAQIAVQIRHAAKEHGITNRAGSFGESGVVAIDSIIGALYISNISSVRFNEY